MNYRRHYALLINRARHRTLTGYFERHHIVPRCMNGSDLPRNIVRLTPEEHYIAHLLLVKIHPNEPGLIYAAILMTADRWGTRVHNKLYGWIRRRFNEVNLGPRTKEHKDKIRKRLLGRKLPEEHKKHISDGLKGRKFSDEHKARIGAANRKRDKAIYENLSKKFQGHEVSAETRERIADGWTEERKKEQSERQTGRKRSKKTGKRISQAWTEERRKWLVENNPGKTMSEETKKRISDAAIARYADPKRAREIKRKFRQTLSRRTNR